MDVTETEQVVESTQETTIDYGKLIAEQNAKIEKVLGMISTIAQPKQEPEILPVNNEADETKAQIAKLQKEHERLAGEKKDAIFASRKNAALLDIIGMGLSREDAEAAIDGRDLSIVPDDTDARIEKLTAWAAPYAARSAGMQRTVKDVLRGGGSDENEISDKVRQDRRKRWGLNPTSRWGERPEGPRVSKKYPYQNKTQH